MKRAETAASVAQQLGIKEQKLTRKLYAERKAASEAKVFGVMMVLDWIDLEASFLHLISSDCARFFFLSLFSESLFSFSFFWGICVFLYIGSTTTPADCWICHRLATRFIRTTSKG